MEAITRKEKIMSGENLTPITRKELFLAKAAGQDVKVPTPITREEWFLSRIGQGGGGGTPQIPTYNGVMPLGKYKVIAVDGEVSIAIGNGLDTFFTYENDGVVVTMGGAIEFFDGALWFMEPNGDYDKTATIGDVIEVTYEYPVTEEQFNAFFHYFTPQ